MPKKRYRPKDIIAKLFHMLYGQSGLNPNPSQLAVDYAECQQHAMVFNGYNPAAPQTFIKHGGIR